MRMTTFHKLILTILAGFLAASLIEGYKWLNHEAEQVSSGVYDPVGVPAAHH